VLVGDGWFDELRELIELLDGTSIVELELQDGDLHIALKREGLVPHLSIQPPAAEAVDEGLAYVTAPLLGTFYRAASPDAEPFVREGEQVERGQVVGLIEAMKIFNEIQAEVSGRVRAILVEDGAFVEADQRLVAIEPEAPEAL
jgi:acetyl-CoA carboxylase biotin carboxyl carrier protein